MKAKLVLVALGCGFLSLCLWHRAKQSPVGPRTSVSRPAGEDQSHSDTNRLPNSKIASSTAARPIIPRTAVSFSNAPESLKEIINLRIDVWKRQQKVRAMAGRNLSGSETKALCDFLLEKHDEDDDQRGHVLKNDIMDALCAQRVPSADLGAVFAQVYGDTKQNVVIRDYAIQHVATLYERLEAGVRWPSGQIKAQKDMLAQTLWDALIETDSSIAGTALLGLSRLADSLPESSQNKISEQAFKLATDESVGELTRVTAIQVCARLEPSQALPLLARLVESGGDASTRISAIGTMGRLGGSAELELLKHIESEDNPRLKPSLLQAMKAIQERLTRL